MGGVQQRKFTMFAIEQQNIWLNNMLDLVVIIAIGDNDSTKQQILERLNSQKPPISGEFHLTQLPSSLDRLKARKLVTSKPVAPGSRTLTYTLTADGIQALERTWNYLFRVFRFSAGAARDAAPAFFRPQSYWDDHPDYPVSDWQSEVVNGNTRQSYVHWVNSQIEQALDQFKIESELGLQS